MARRSHSSSYRGFAVTYVNGRRKGAAIRVKMYVDPDTGRRFPSRPAVDRFIAAGRPELLRRRRNAGVQDKVRAFMSLDLETKRMLCANVRGSPPAARRASLSPRRSPGRARRSPSSREPRIIGPRRKTYGRYGHQGARSASRTLSDPVARAPPREPRVVTVYDGPRRKSTYIEYGARSKSSSGSGFHIRRATPKQPAARGSDRGAKRTGARKRAPRSSLSPAELELARKFVNGMRGRRATITRSAAVAEANDIHSENRGKLPTGALRQKWATYVLDLAANA